MAKNEIFNKHMLAAAANVDLEAAIKNFEAARTRGDTASAEVFRQRAHDLLDSHLDLKAEAIEAVLAVGRTG